MKSFTNSCFAIVTSFLSFNIIAQQGSGLGIDGSSDLRQQSVKRESNAATSAIPDDPNLGDYTRESQSSRLGKSKAIDLKTGVDNAFEAGWSALAQGKSEIALKAFSALMKKRQLLNNRQKSDTYLGYGISLYSEGGCGEARRPLELSMGFPHNQDDATYYLGMCDFQEGNYSEARKKFQTLADMQHPKYADPARFHIGMIDEDNDDFDDAKSRYQDIIDFTEDKALAKIVGVRLALLEVKMARDRRRKKRLTALLSAGLGYDSNATLLPPHF